MLSLRKKTLLVAVVRFLRNNSWGIAEPPICTPLSTSLDFFCKSSKQLPLNKFPNNCCCMALVTFSSNIPLQLNPLSSTAVSFSNSIFLAYTVSWWTFYAPIRGSAKKSSASESRRKNRTKNRKSIPRYNFNTISCAFRSHKKKMFFVSMLGKRAQLQLSRVPGSIGASCDEMRSEIVSELLTMMLRKFIKTKIIVCQNVNFMLNLLNSYDGSRRRRDRSKRSHHRQSPEQDVKQQRRHRKPLNGEKTEAVRSKVSRFARSN